MRNVTVTFGEIMLRLAPPDFERFLQSPRFDASFGGGEANVAVALAQFGLRSVYVSVLPEKNPIADAAIGDLRRFGVDTSQIVRGKGRMGIYYIEAGANQRSSQVAYDREHSAIALAKRGDINWSRIFELATWFHLTGSTPAISATACELALESVRKAQEMGVTVSCDLNFRKNLWRWEVGHGSHAGGNKVLLLARQSHVVQKLKRQYRKWQRENQADVRGWM